MKSDFAASLLNRIRSVPSTSRQACINPSSTVSNKAFFTGDAKSGSMVSGSAGSCDGRLDSVEVFTG